MATTKKIATTSKKSFTRSRKNVTLSWATKNIGKAFKEDLQTKIMSENTKQNDEWKQRELGALWRVDGQKQSYYSGSIKDADGNDLKIVCFPNSFKEKGSNQPDIRIYASKEKD